MANVHASAACVMFAPPCMRRVHAMRWRRDGVGSLSCGWQAWLVAPAVATYDMDNLRLEDLGSARAMSAEFELEHLLVTGHASEAPSEGAPVQRGAGAPPRGLQLTLAPAGGAAGADGESGAAGGSGPGAAVGTIVMANLGYFQLKANPGLHALTIAQARACADAFAKALPRRCPGTALALPWHCPGSAQALPWHCQGTALALPRHTQLCHLEGCSRARAASTWPALPAANAHRRRRCPVALCSVLSQPPLSTRRTAAPKT